MGWSRVDDPSNLLTPGEPITVKVLAVDEARQKISLGLKQLSDDPWSRVPGAYEIGQVRTGRVTRVADFGAFVELEPGIEALAHASTFPASGRRETWSTMAAPGTTALFEIVSIDVPRKRIGVAPVPEGSARARAHEAALAGEQPAHTSEKTPESGQGFGSLADKLRGALGPKD
jgi:small subunit ribosomal protein S1